MSAMKGKDKYRISPNEEERLLKEDTEKRRKLRLLQVREQAKERAKLVREEVRIEKEKQLIKLARSIETDLERQKQEHERELEEQYKTTLKNIGQGHKEAIEFEYEDKSFERLKKKLEAQENATRRHMKALEQLKHERLLRAIKDNQTIMSRRAALETEKYRAAEMASKPLPPPNPVDQLVRCHKPVLMTDMNAFSATHYHMPEYAIVKANSVDQVNGKLEAEDEDYRIKESVKERERVNNEQAAKARIRGSSALRKEHLKHEYAALVEDLSFLQRADRRRRQEIVADLPKQVFIPPDRRIIEKDQDQRNMEKHFENLYLDGMDKGENLLLSLPPDPISPDTPPASEDLDLSLPNTPEKLSNSRGITTSRDTTTDPIAEDSKLVEKRETVLRKLLNRIHEQRDSHVSRSKLENSHLDIQSTSGVKFKVNTPPQKGYNVEYYQQLWEDCTD